MFISYTLFLYRRVKLPLGMREERAFRRAYIRYLRTLEEMNFEDPEDIASVLATAELLISLKKAKVKV